MDGARITAGAVVATAAGDAAGVCAGVGMSVAVGVGVTCDVGATQPEISSETKETYTIPLSIIKPPEIIYQG